MRKPQGGQGESDVVAHPQDLENDEDQGAAHDCCQVAEGVELSQAGPGFAFPGQLHPDGGGHRHEHVLSQAVNEQADDQDDIGRRSEAHQERAGDAQDQGHRPQPPAAQEPQESRDKDHQESRQLTGKFEERALESAEGKPVVQVIIQGGVDDAVSDAHG